MIARVFPRRTHATPVDDLAFSRAPVLSDFAAGITEVHVSVAFTYDIAAAEKLARAWEGVAPVKLGGPAFSKPAEEFEPGVYLKPGYTITSRGCPNRCAHCAVCRTQPKARELQIKDGWNICDDNLLACSEVHIRNVFAMLKQQRHRAEFTGGLEAARLQPWHVDLLEDLRPRRIYFAYDDEHDWEPLKAAADLLRPAGLLGGGHIVSCYVLCGYAGDTMGDAEKRMRRVLTQGMTPTAMLWRRRDGNVDSQWRTFQRTWFRPTMIWARAKSEARQPGGIPCK